jgi:hypothetical protein
MYDEKTLKEMVKEELWEEFVYQTETIKRLMSDGVDDEDFYDPIEVRDVCDVTRVLIDAYNDPNVSDSEFTILTNGVDKRYYKFMLDRYNDPFKDSPIAIYRRSHGLSSLIADIERTIMEYSETK